MIYKKIKTDLIPKSQIISTGFIEMYKSIVTMVRKYKNHMMLNKWFVESNRKTIYHISCMRRGTFAPSEVPNTTSHLDILHLSVGSCGRVDSVMNSNITGPGFNTVLSIELPTDNHPNNIIELSVRGCVWKVGEGFPVRDLPKTLNWVAVYSSVTFYTNG